MLGIEPVIEKLRTLENATLDRSVISVLQQLLTNKAAGLTQCSTGTHEVAVIVQGLLWVCHYWFDGTSYWEMKTVHASLIHEASHAWITLLYMEHTLKLLIVCYYSVHNITLYVHYITSVRVLSTVKEPQTLHSHVSVTWLISCSTSQVILLPHEAD